MLRAMAIPERQRSRNAPVSTRRIGPAESPAAKLRSAYGNQAILHWAATSKNDGSTLQRKCSCSGSGVCNCDKKEKEGSLQLKVADAGPVSTVPPLVHEVLRSPGQPLDARTRAFMGPRFGYDFSHVRVHTDVNAGDSAHAVNALAYTVGQDVVFGPGQYAPASGDGRKLLAHELTHVVQQNGPNTSTPPNLTIDPADSRAECDAELVASRFTGEDTRGPDSRSAGSLLVSDATSAVRLQCQAGQLPAVSATTPPATGCDTPKNPDHSGPGDNPHLGQETEGRLKALIVSDCLLPFSTGMCEDGIAAQRAHDEAAAKSESLLAAAPMDKCGPPEPGGDHWPGSAKLPGRIDGPDDAFRHCFASCVLASRTSGVWAERVGTDHENSQDPNSLAGQMDLHNNSIGRSFAKLRDESGCEGNCQEAVRSGALRTIQVRAPNCGDEICKGRSDQPWPSPVAPSPAPPPVPAPPLLQRKYACAGGYGGQYAEGEKEESALMLDAGSGPTSRVPSIVHEVLRSTGSPLDRGTRDIMEPRFGYDFGHARVHTDGKAAASTRAVDALAYTVGHNIVFGHRQYAPERDTGRWLLAHELAHVVQQGGVGAGSLVIGVSDGTAERQADSAATLTMQGGVVNGLKTQPVWIARQAAPAVETPSNGTTQDSSAGTASSAGCTPGEGIPNSTCFAYLAHAWWLPLAYVNNATCACRATPNIATANCVRKFLQDRLAATPTLLKVTAAAQKHFELTDMALYQGFVQSVLTPRIYADHVDAYRSCCCPFGPAPLVDWIGVTTIPIQPCSLVGTFIEHFGSCTGTPGSW